ncbi:MAG: hypothetical protein IKJ49_05590 [Bacteroidaceae bacterium]|nr:hypothetical protein [Bacteroidaceae bacterium]
MKRELIFMFACIVSVMTTVVSCSSDEFEDAYTQEEPQKTRAVRTGMTMEEVQARLDEIGTRYGVAIMIEESENISVINEKYFTDVENLLKNGIREDTNIEARLLDDRNIDNFAVTSSSRSQILLENGTLYSGSFMEISGANCIINWAVTSNPLTYYVSAEPRIKDGGSNAIIKWFSPFSGNLKNPRFSYYGIFYYTFDEYVDENGDGLLDLDSMIEIETFEFRGTKSEQTTPYM